MHIILCHTTADFDTLGAAVGLTRLIAGAKLVLPGGTHPGVHNFLALYRDEYAIAEMRSLHPHQIETLHIVDTQQRERLGQCGEWLDLPQLTAIEIYDHHLHTIGNISATKQQIEPVGATTTLIAELLQQQSLSLTTAEATVMALGIHVDTGSLTFQNTTARDATALAWLLSQGAQLDVIANYREQRLSTELQHLLPIALEKLQTTTLHGYHISFVALETEHFVPGLSSLISELVAVTSSDMMILGASYPSKKLDEYLLTIIGRSQISGVNLGRIFQEWGGGGHDQAAALNRHTIDPANILAQVMTAIQSQIPEPITAQNLMSSPVRTIRPEMTIIEAHRILLRYGHAGLCVMTPGASGSQLVGIIARRDLDLALHHGFADAPVKGYMQHKVQTITPTTSLPDIQELMVTYDIGRLPVLRDGQLVGIVTRTDVLRHQYPSPRHSLSESKYHAQGSNAINVNLSQRLQPELWQVLQTAAELAQTQGWQLYLVGGAVRDILLATEQSQLLLPDLDLVVDGFDRAADDQAGVDLAQALQQIYPSARIDVHGQFQTAALRWHQDPVLGSLAIDIATARTEFYPYPAANPEVAASSIQQDLYRRDFTINALAMRLTAPHVGEILDFFGGLLDLQAQQIRVLHANSFIEDPTRIYRGVRFAVRLGFQLESQTVDYIKYAISSGVYDRTITENTRVPALQTRLRSELKYILQTDYWLAALEQLNALDALKCLHPNLKLDDELRRRLHRGDELLQSRTMKTVIPDLSPWRLRLEILLTNLNLTERLQVAQQLQLPEDSQQLLAKIDLAHQELVMIIEDDVSIGQLVIKLAAYAPLLILLITIMARDPISTMLYQYLSHWCQIKAPIAGDDLKALGYKPGVMYKQMLESVLIATIDGQITNREQAISFIKDRYPHPTENN